MTTIRDAVKQHMKDVGVDFAPIVRVYLDSGEQITLHSNNSPALDRQAIVSKVELLDETQFLFGHLGGYSNDVL